MVKKNMKKIKFGNVSLKRRLYDILIFIFGVFSSASPFYNCFIVKHIVPDLTSESIQVTEQTCENIFGAAAAAVVNYTYDYIYLSELIFQLGIFSLFLVTWFKMTLMFFRFLKRGFSLKLDDCDLFLGFMLDLSMFYLSVIIMSFSVRYIYVNNAFLLAVLSQTGFAHFIRKADVVVKF